MTALLLAWRYLRVFWPYIASALVTLALAALIWRAPWAETRGRDAAVAKYQPVMDRALMAINTTAQRIKDARAKAEADDLAHARAIEIQQTKVTANVSATYQAQLADLRARYDRLRASAANQAAGGGGRVPPVPSLPYAASGLDGAAVQDGLPDALTASAQALQLQALQQWVRDQANIDRNAK